MTGARAFRLSPERRGRGQRPRLALLLLLAGPLLAGAAGAQVPENRYAEIRRLMADSPEERRAAARLLLASPDPALVPALVDALFFIPKGRRAEALAVLAALAGENPGERYHDWVDLVARRAELRPAPGYAAWKGELLARIDPRYREVLAGAARPGSELRPELRLEEVVWGGVPVEGIPALDRPAVLSAVNLAAEAGGPLRLLDDERVFGVFLGGEARAYPLRVLDWHEMLNDVVGGEPVTLSYCTLCRSAVLFSGRPASGGEPLTFGTSGLLYRSNKLMIDRRTGSLWSNLTGEAVLGPMAAQGAALDVLPLTLTTWKDWRTRHPRTTVLAADPEAGRRWGYDYSPGAADRRRAGVSFPSGPPSMASPGTAAAPGAREEVFAVRLAGLAKAYPLAAVLRERAINDRLGGPAGTALVVVGDAESGAARAYRRGERTFSPGAGAGELVDEAGRRWSVGEDALSLAGQADRLERIPGHMALWFAWSAFFPHSELYQGVSQ